MLVAISEWGWGITKGHIFEREWRLTLPVEVERRCPKAMSD